MANERWIWATVALASGLMLGELGGQLVRAARGSADRPARVRAGAKAMGNFVFWTATTVGLIIAVAILDEDELASLGDTLGDNVPRFLLAAVMLIVGYGVAVAVAAAVGQSAKRASGVRHRNLERSLRVVIVLAATAVALTQVGVSSSTLAVLLAGLVGAPALAVALLSALGGREVAGQLAAGRALRHQLREGWTLSFSSEPEGPLVGRIVDVHPTAVEIELADGARLMVPNRRLLEAPFSVRP